MALPETTQEWIERYEKRYQRAYDNYQQSGDARYDSQQYEYRCIADAFEAKLKQEKERGDEIQKRMRNKNFAVDRLYKNEYTREEVIKLLDDAVWW